jgi:hypothetical protein
VYYDVLCTGPPIPGYARETRTSIQHSRQRESESQPLGHTIDEKLAAGESLELPSFLSALDSIPSEGEAIEREKLPSAVKRI